MGTSNWQQIPFCIEALMKIAPSRMLDVGVGFGRWGIITREFCDVWYQRVFKEEWAVHLEGIEGFPRNIADYHHSFYNKIHVGDASDIIPTLPGPWSVVMFGDVLEHFTKEKAHELLNICLDRSDYVIVNIPIGEDFEQGDAYGNQFERHLSQWWPEDFKAFALVRHHMMEDYIGRPHGSFILSRKDPKNLRASLFSQVDPFTPKAPPAPAADVTTLLNRISEQAFELQFIKRSESYKLANRLRRNPLIQSARGILKPAGPTVRIESLGRPGVSGQGCEVWVLGLQNSASEPAVPWEFVDLDRSWIEHQVESRPYGRCFMSVGGQLTARTGIDPAVTLMRHPWSGMVRVEFEGRTEVLDLSSPETGQVVIYPARTPMLPAQPAPQTLITTAPITAEPKPLPRKAPQERLFSAAEIRFIETTRSQSPTHLAIHCPRWLGVTSSTRVLFEHTYAVPADKAADPSEMTDEEIEHQAQVIAAARVPHLIFSGGDESHLKIGRRVRQLAPSTTIDLFWHGSYMQIIDDYVWHILKQWIGATRDGTVRGILTCKAGMEDFFRSLGVPSCLLLNYVPGEVLPPPELPSDPIRVGVWLSWTNARKSPHAMLCALKMMGNAQVHGAGLDARSQDLMKFLGLDSVSISPVPIPQTELLPAMRHTHISMYVTLSECCPMLPMESLMMGVPCLVGPVSHLFEDNAYLHDRLVVDQPERADVLARYAQQAFNDREEIVAEYARYIPGYIERAKASIRRYMEEGPTADRNSLRIWPPAAMTMMA